MFEYSREILTVLSLVVFSGISLWRREWGIYLIILLLPTYQIRFQVFGVPLTFLEGMVLILAVITAFSSLRGAKRRSNPMILRLLHFIRNDKFTLIFILLFLTAALISVFTAPNLIKAAGIFKAYFFEAILFFFLTLLIADSKEKQNRLFRILALLVLYLSVFGIYQFITLERLPSSWWGVNVESRRIISLLNHPNALALLLGPILAMLIFSPKKKKLEWVSIALGLPALYLTFSRASWLALLITVVGIASFKKTNLKKLTAYSLLLFFLVLIVPYSRSILLELATGSAATQQNRYVLWSAAVDILKKSPVFGTGLMGFHEAYKAYPLGPDQVVQNYPHNFFLNFWVETGLLGLVSIIGLLILFFRKAYKTMTSPSPPLEEGAILNTPPREGENERGLSGYALAAAAGMSMIVLHGLVDVSYFKNDLSVLFWLIYSLPFLKTTSWA